MCLRCDGYSEEQVRGAIELTIATHGWALQSVVPDHDTVGPHWTYTIGLTEGFGVCELIVTDLEPGIAGQLLNSAADIITGGGDLDDLVDCGVTTRRVHDVHLGGELFYGWADYYDRDPAEVEFVQLILPDGSYCDCHQPLVADLADPGDGFPDNRRLPAA